MADWRAGRFAMGIELDGGFPRLARRRPRPFPVLVVLDHVPLTLSAEIGRKALVRLRLAERPGAARPPSGRLTSAANPAAGPIRTGDRERPKPCRFLLRVDDFPSPFADLEEFPRFHRIAVEHGYRTCWPSRLFWSRMESADRCPTPAVGRLHACTRKAPSWRSTDSRTRAATATTGASCCRCRRPRCAPSSIGRTNTCARTISRRSASSRPINTYDPLTIRRSGGAFPLICGGPESVVALGYRAGPSFLLRSLYVPSYRGAYDVDLRGRAFRSMIGRGRRPDDSGDAALGERAPRRLSRVPRAVRAASRPHHARGATSSRRRGRQVAVRTPMSVLTHFVLWTCGPGTGQHHVHQPPSARASNATRAGRTRLAEIGCWHGVNTRRLRRAMASGRSAVWRRSVCAGPARLQRAADHRASRSGQRSERTMRWIRMTDLDAARWFVASNEAPLDFVFSDSLNRCEGFRATWEAWSPLVAPARGTSSRTAGRLPRCR